MGYRTFQIFVDSPTATYYPGSKVTGRVLLALEKPKRVRGLRIKFKGYATVSWSETETVSDSNNESRTETVDYTAKEEYFSNKYYLIGSENSEVEIPAGKNVYPFSTTLPPQIPSSFSSKHGHVKYSITAVLDRPWKIDKRNQYFIDVINLVDLNLLLEVKEPVKKEVNKTFGCLFCKSRPLTITGTIPFSGYTPGQNIVTTIEVDNASNVLISSVNCKLIKKLTWIARYPSTKSKIDRMVVDKMELDQVPPNASRGWTQQIGIPQQIPFVNLCVCSIIKEEFFIEIEACVPCPHTNLVLTLPFVLGNVPLLPS